MSWDKAKKTREEASSGTAFIRLKDGDKMVGVFAGEPITFFSIFKQQEMYSKKVQGSSFKFRINFIESQNGKWVPRILEQGAGMFDAIVACKEKYGIDKVAFEIGRKGQGKDDTVYSVLFDNNLTDADLEQLKKVKLFDLKPKTPMKDKLDAPESHDSDVPPPDDSDIHF